MRTSAYKKKHNAKYRKMYKGTASKPKPRKQTVETCNGRTVNRKANSKRCFWCNCYLLDFVNDGLPALPMFRTVDHVIPLSRGGPNRQVNRVPSCWGCNQRKQNDIPTDEILKSLDLLTLYRELLAKEAAAQELQKNSLIEAGPDIPPK